MNFMILFISGSEVFVIVLVILLLFGSKKIPELARGLGKGIKEFKKATDDIKKEISENSSELTKDIKDIRDEVKKDLEA
jgi:sec-independent protein translocase protein TatA